MPNVFPEDVNGLSHRFSFHAAFRPAIARTTKISRNDIAFVET
jgi:hypothetical protein